MTEYRTYAIKKRQTCQTCARRIEVGAMARVTIEGSGRDTFRTYRHAGPCPGPTDAEKREAAAAGDIDWQEAYDNQRAAMRGDP